MIAEATANSGILEKLLPEFESETGIHVTLEQAPYDSLVQKAVLDFTTKKGNYDVLSIPYEYLGSFAENSYIMPIDSYLATSPVKTGSDFSTSDILPNLWEPSSKWKDKYYGMPSNSAMMMMLYRKDLFEDPAEAKGFQAKYGYALAPAKTWDQYRDIAEWFTRAAGKDAGGKALEQPLYGVTLAGKRHVSTVLEWMNYSWTFGGAIFDSSGNVAINSPANVASLEYEKSLTAFAPPGFTSATWDEITAQLQQGTAAQSITWGDTAGAMEDPTSSKVVGKMGYASIPVKSDGDTPESHLGSWTYTINAASKNAEASYEFMAWALSKPVQQKLAEGGGLPALTSVLTDAGLTSKLPYWKQIYTSLTQAKSRPRLPQWSGIADSLALDLSRALSGQASPQEALDSSQQKVTELMAGALPVTYQ
ncbi:MAG: extracellular solute-binding protein [Actinobacteria bacterium]|nr:extracellular solute-binding protein [Actinomycetota bacterium]